MIEEKTTQEQDVDQHRLAIEGRVMMGQLEETRELIKEYTVIKKTVHPKCPRCWRHLAECNYNFDNLCDRCCAMIPEGHDAYEGIKQKRLEQRNWTPQQWREHNHAISPDEWPL